MARQPRRTETDVSAWTCCRGLSVRDAMGTGEQEQHSGCVVAQWMEPCEADTCLEE